jgi:hypothetical protein
MKLRDKAGLAELRWDELEPGAYTVHYEHRTMDDIKALNPEGREEEALFSTLSKVSELNADLYKQWMRPWMQMTAFRPVADALGKQNPLRLQRQLLSDQMPFAPFIRQGAEWARTHRAPIAQDHPLRAVEKQVAASITEQLNTFRDRRNEQSVQLARQLYGAKGLGALFPPDTPDADVAHARALKELEAARTAVLPDIAKGGFAEGVCRIVLAGMVSIGSFERRSLRLARLLAQLPGTGKTGVTAQTDWIKLLKAQARITAVAPVEALNALEQLLPDAASRENALALSAAVMMIEPTLANPRSEIIEFVMATLGADPDRVIELARKLTDSLEKPATRRKAA